MNKSILPTLINFLFEKHSEVNEHEYPAIEGIVSLLDRYGTYINNKDVLRTEDLSEQNSQINFNIQKLISLNYQNRLLGHVKFKIINLNEKRKRNWVSSLTEKNNQIKSLSEVNDELLIEKNKSSSFNGQTIFDNMCLSDYSENREIISYLPKGLDTIGSQFKNSDSFSFSSTDSKGNIVDLEQV